MLCWKDLAKNIICWEYRIVLQANDDEAFEKAFIWYRIL
jgi:hypothetical protein